MGNKLKMILLSTVFLCVGFLGLAINENKVSAGVGDTFYDNFADSQLAEYMALRRSKLATEEILPADVAAITTLSIYDDLGITDLSGIETFTAIKSIAIFDNPIVTIPDAINELTLLKELFIYDGSLTTLPDSIGTMTGLTTIGIIENQLVSLPSSIADLHGLKYLDVSGNQDLGALPVFSGSYPDLTTVLARDCGLETIDPSISALTNLGNLDLSNNKITAVPDSISGLTQLYALALQNNKISVLPDAISQLTGLSFLELYDNDLIALPANIGDLTNLMELELRGNQITALPDSIKQMTNLNRLGLGNNGLTTVPSIIAEIPSLYSLDLTGNTIRQIPASFVDATAINVVILDDNGLTEIPAGLELMPSLGYVSFANNDIAEIPSDFTSARFPALSSVSFAGNKLKGLPVFDSAVNFPLTLDENQLVERLDPALDIMTFNQKATLESLVYEKANESDPTELDIMAALPPILIQFYEITGDFSECKWQVKQPDGTLVDIAGDDPDAMELINDALSVGYGDYMLTFNVEYIPQFRILYAFLKGSVYELPITIRAEGTLVDEALLNGSVKDKATNLPIENATIELKENNSVVGSRTTGADGLYEFLDPEAKTYDIIASATGYKTVIGTVTVPAGEAVTKNFLLEAGEGTIIEKPEVPGGTVDGGGNEESSQLTGSYGLPKTGNQLIVVVCFMSLLLGTFLIRKIKY